jgi:hypothetical protein
VGVNVLNQLGGDLILLAGYALLTGVRVVTIGADVVEETNVMCISRSIRSLGNPSRPRTRPSKIELCSECCQI